MPRSRKLLRGYEFILSTAWVWRLLVGHISRGMCFFVRISISSESSKARTPWPILDAPNSSAVRMLLGPSASPAWMVNGIFLFWASEKMSWKSDVGNNASAPAKSIATTPPVLTRYFSAKRTVSRFSDLLSFPRMQHRIRFAKKGVSAIDSWSFWKRFKPSKAAKTASSWDIFPCVWSCGANRTSAYTTSSSEHFSKTR